MASKISATRGTTITISGTVTDGGTAVNLTGATVFFTVKTAEYDTDTLDTSAVVSKTVTSFASPTTGAYTITINPSDTSTLTPGAYFYDIRVKYSTGAIYKLDEGKFILDGSPTNRTS